MTLELFREDAYLKSCRARVVAVDPAGIRLDRTVFYPEGGGQPGDAGELVLDDGSILPIVTTRATPEGILHVPAEGGALPAPGTELTARIDWDTRHRHMRVHTCLHLLCALIPHPVTGGAIARDRGRLDFDMEQGLDKATVEAALNRLVSADHPVGYRWISDEEMAANMALVRTMSVQPPMGRGRVRLVDVDGVDLQPCGGTHVARTGEIGAVTLGKVENKGKHNRRVHVLLGD
ncbi:MAG: alanyl-tRNA editing protein [Gammaproteobacteria bacterium]